MEINCCAADQNILKTREILSFAWKAHMKRRVLFALGLLCLTFWCWDQVPSARVTKKEDLREAIATMLATPGPYLLDVIVPHQVGKSC